MSQQWIRDYNLTVSGSGGSINLSNFRIVFEIHHKTVQTPNNGLFRIYNLSRNTANRLGSKEFTDLTFSAGYVGNTGVIFKGSIIQPIKGRETPTDTFVQLLCQEGDAAYNFSVANKTLAAGSTARDHVNVMLEAMKPFGITAGFISDTLTKFRYPRSVSFFGMARDYLRSITHSAGCTWSINQGKLDILAVQETKPGNTIVLNSHTGMIGMPQETTDGIYVRALINPSFQVGGKLQIDQDTIQQATFGSNVQDSAQNDMLKSDFYGRADGTYKILAMDYLGDTRGPPWYADLTCIGAKTGNTPPSNANNLQGQPYLGAN
ncbi:phage protein [Labrys neptuniae]